MYCNAIKSFKKQKNQLAFFEPEWVAYFHRNTHYLAKDTSLYFHWKAYLYPRLLN
jgi:hypothetical protein